MPAIPPYDSAPLEQFAVEVFSELNEETIVRRAHEVNVLLRMSMLAGLEMQLEATLNMICDLAGEITTFQRGAVFFWDEDEQVMHVRVTRNMEDPDSDTYTRANVLNYWTAKLSRPLLLRKGNQPEADALLKAMRSESVLVIPLFVRNRVMGSLQLFGESLDSFTLEDAQLLWILSLVAESMLTRDYSNESLLRFAFTDYLTGLKTRGFFEQQLDLELARAERRGTSLSLLMVDIDHFKRLNDTHGHHVGDVVLRDVASILTKDMREVDTVARYGGEEFVLILPETGGKGAFHVAQRLRSSVEQAKFFTGSNEAIEHVTISIGIAVFGSDAHFKRDLIDFADAALYEAKERGRNQVIMYADMKSQRAS